MTLDFWLVARLAKDIHTLMAGSRIQSLAATDSGIIFHCYRRGAHLALHISVDSSVPLAGAYALDDGAKENGTEGWMRGVAALLRGATIDAVHAVPNDRVLYIDVSSRSPFGVPSSSRIVAELQPRKANALVLRRKDGDWVIVAAAKQFDGADDARSVKIGAPYVPPPQRRARLDRAQFIVAAREIDSAELDRLARLLGDVDPECTPLLAREVLFRVGSGAGGSARTLLDAWAALRREVEDALEACGDVFVVRKNGSPGACHLVSLGHALQTAERSAPAEPFWVRSVNELCVEALLDHPRKQEGPSTKTLRKKLTTMLTRCGQEVASLEAAQLRAAQADALREAGDAIYAQLTEIAPGSSTLQTAQGREVKLDPLLTAKENAAEYFRAYKKARSGLPRIATRLRELRANREYWEQLLWELARADGMAQAEQAVLLGEIADAVGIKRQRTRKRRTAIQERRLSLSGGAVALVGRSPKENERLTFSVASPGDFWFHARGIPGAHVIVKTGGSEITKEQIHEAAALAAGNSRASGAGYVEVDYTQRKHVRRHSSGRPGLVWYTDFASVRVRPKPE
jgi:predicted ribosome quality control (RQC) complex YloA/Tae2 family protein